MSVTDYSLFVRMYNRKHNCSYILDNFKNIMKDYHYSKNGYDVEIENCDIACDNIDEFVVIGYLYILGKVDKLPKNLVQPFVEKVLYNSEAEEQVKMLKERKYSKYFKSFIGKEFDDIMKEVKKIHNEDII